MAVQLKRLDQQVIVITGASSGIGLTTAKMAASRGARVVLAARDEPDLRAAVDAIRGAGGEAILVVADVDVQGSVDEVAAAAVREFGGFDSWVNNAGLSIYGPIEEVPFDDARRLFDVNYWGVVHGSLAALPFLKERGGALINIGSVLSDRAIPLQGHYSASKHAVKAFTDSLRMELEKENAPVSVTLVKPGAIDTPYPEHARNYMEAEPKHPPPVYAPEVVAETILFCAEHARRDVIVGGGGKMTAAMDAIPRVADRYMRATMFDQQKRREASRPGRRDTLYSPSPGDGRERGEYPGRVMQSSLYTRATLRPVATLLGVAAVGVGMAFAARSLRDD
jgi:NAD(P)-dependent dehydrogenase (short-subunit alcohol dehydrogenase family)